MSKTPTKPELIVALDVPSSSYIPEIVQGLPDEISYYKVGLELFTSEGPAALDYLMAKEKNVFLDLKLHDIPRTVSNAVKTAARHGVKMLTIHAGGGSDMMRAAADTARELEDEAPAIVAVTTLTSLDQNDLKELGITRALKDHTFALAELAVSSGVDGMVCSPLEVETFRAKLGPSPIIVTPGIRLRQEAAGNDQADQKRIATPDMAVKAGSNFLVVGRPILQADDPMKAAQKILDQMHSAE